MSMCTSFAPYSRNSFTNLRLVVPRTIESSTTAIDNNTGGDDGGGDDGGGDYSGGDDTGGDTGFDDGGDADSGTSSEEE